MSQMDSTYKIIRKLGSGSGGNVYLAEHLRLNKKVVLKAYKSRITASQELVRREVDILKELSHPHIPRVYDFFIEDGNIYTAMDFIEGESLDKALKRGEAFSQAQIIRWAIQLLDALAYLHTPIHGEPPKGYVHSDIKPANLMRTPNGDICLIDFNISGALGEKNVIGFSAGYASPEHYGQDFSSAYAGDDLTQTMLSEEETDLTQTMLSEEETDLTQTMLSEGGLTATEDTEALTMAGEFDGSLSGAPSGTPGYYHSAGISERRLITPDVRSDIYSVGATLYHLLSGKRPKKNATEVERLSEEHFNPQIVRIISKAMNPNRDLRYQTAQEMKRDFLNLRENDPRIRRWKRRRRAAAILFPTFFVIGGLLSFTGLKRIQMMENWLKRTEYSQAALERGDVEEALEDALQVISESSEQWLPQYVPGIQKVLTESLGVYDLSDSYKIYRTIELPSSPIYMEISPTGKTGATLCGQTVVVFDTENAEILAELPTDSSPISQIKYLNNDTLIYAGNSGMTAYDIKAGRDLWKGDKATAISVSADGKCVAGIFDGDSSATVYDAETGEVKQRIDFGGRCQNIGIKDNLFALNHDGALLGVSFEDGSLQIFSLKGPENDLVIYGKDSGYTHFEGGFSEKYFAFLAAGKEKSVFAVIDTEKGEEAGGFRSENAFGLQADGSGVYVQSENILVKINPVTGEQIPVVTMGEDILRFVVSGEDTVVTSDKEITFFDKNARQTSCYKKEYQSDLVCMANGTAVIGSMDRPILRIMQYEENPKAERFTYDPEYDHREARVSSDGETVVLFSYQNFRIYDREGTVLKEVMLPDSKHVLDQQFIREDGMSYLEVTYDNGKADIYSAKDGALLREESAEMSAENLDEEFLVDNLRIESPLHGTPTVYDVKTGKELARLKKDTYLTYVEKAGDYIVAQYITADGYRSGQLLNKKCEVLAELPHLCDVIGDKLIFDYPSGSVRESGIYNVDELIRMANEFR